MINVDKVVRANDKVIFDFYAEWCGPCKSLAPILKKVEGATDIKVVKVDVEKEADLAQLFGISSVPTMVFYQDSEMLATKIGVVPFDTIVDIFA